MGVTEPGGLEALCISSPSSVFNTRGIYLNISICDNVMCFLFSFFPSFSFLYVVMSYQKLRAIVFRFCAAEDTKKSGSAHRRRIFSLFLF